MRKVATLSVYATERSLNASNFGESHICKLTARTFSRCCLLAVSHGCAKAQCMMLNRKFCKPAFDNQVWKDTPD